MSVTVTIEQTSPQANAIIEMLRAFDFVTFKEPKKAKVLGDTWKQEQQYTIYFCHFHLLHFLVLNRYRLLLLINPLAGHFPPFEVFFG